MKRLFVGGLPYSLTDAQLKDLFAQVATVTSSNIIMDRYSGRSKGFGFVDIENDEEAEKAIQTLNGTEVDGRKIIVNIARPMEERPSGNFHSGGGGHSDRPRRDSRQKRY